jgi:putative IMPACT (imprinted ancient) family translation regulator
MLKLTYRTIEGKFEYEIPKIKGSRFLTYIFPCADKETAESLLEQIRKEHFSATHHCSAWRL